MRAYQLLGGPIMKFIIFAMLTGMLVCFQNCSDKQFSARTDLNKSASIDGTEQLIADDTEIDMVNDDENLEFENEDNDKDYVATEEDEDKDETAEDGDDDKDNDKKICMRHGVKLNATDVGVCILEGSGKSQRVALINDQLASNNSTPKTVCMSALACRRIVDSKFKVVSLEKRGFCKNGSADSVSLTDEQVRTLIGKIQ
jgi:hypothetical protein